MEAFAGLNPSLRPEKFAAKPNPSGNEQGMVGKHRGKMQNPRGINAGR